MKYFLSLIIIAASFTSSASTANTCHTSSIEYHSSISFDDGRRKKRKNKRANKRRKRKCKQFGKRVYAR